MRRTLKIYRTAWTRFGNCPDSRLRALPQSGSGKRYRPAPFFFFQQGRVCRFSGSPRGESPARSCGSRNNSVRETNAQPAPATGLFTGVGVRPQRAKMDFQRSCWKSILSICGNKCTAREVAKLSPHNLLQAPFMFDNLSNTANILFIHSGGVLQFCIRGTTTAQ